MALSSVLTIAEISALLREKGEDELADRLDYLASDEDLDPGGSPATDESARGFFEFFTSVKCDSKVGLACSPEGWIVGEWRWFPDKRSASIWFLDDERVMFTARKSNGERVAIGERKNFTERFTLARVFVQEGLLSWRLNQQGTRTTP